VSLPDTVSRADLAKALPFAGAMIRYACYIIGIFIVVSFALLGVPMRPAPVPVSKVEGPPAFHLAAPHLQRLSKTTQILRHRYYGRIEVRHYGQLYDRDVDLTIGMILPPPDTPMIREFGQQLRDIRPMATARAVFGTVYYDLDTRFGPVRATEMRVESDGQWKQCLGYLSRFETLSLYITGWYCDASGAKPSPEKLACTLDRLTLDRDVDSKEANAFLRERIGRPSSCSAVPVSQTIDTRSRSNLSSPQRWSTPSSTYRRY
jgi:hypothetical protein